MANNDLLVRASPQTIQPRLESKQQEQVKQSSVDSLSETEQSPVTKQVQQEEQQESQVGELQEKVAQLNQHMQSLNRNLQFSVDEVSGDTVVTVVDAETEEVVRQIPSQEVLDARNAVEQYRGILLETKV